MYFRITLELIFSAEPDSCLIYLQKAKGFITKLNIDELEALMHQKIRLELLKSIYWKKKGDYNMAYEVAKGMSTVLFSKLQDTTYFFTNAKVLTYFCFFALKVENPSHAYQFVIMLNALFENCLKSLQSHYLDEL